MIVVTVELHSAVTRKKSNLSTIIIDNVGGTKARGNYRVRAYRKGYDPYKNPLKGVVREGCVEGHARLAEPVNNLVYKALKSLGYE